MRNCVENEVRLARPTLAESCDKGGSRSAAIEIFCLSCMGNSLQTVKSCKSYTCPLWRFRPGVDKTPPPEGHLPTEEDYKKHAKSDETTKKRQEWGKKLAEISKEKKLQKNLLEEGLK